VTSVTQALGIIAKPALINWAANMAVDCIKDQIAPGQSYDELQLSAIFESGRKAHFQKKKDAGDKGTMIHKWVEGYIKGENPPMPINKDLQEAVKRFLMWVAKHKVKFLLSEQQVYSQKFNYTGTLDFVCVVDGKMYVGDLKTSSGVYPEYMVQTAAYRYAREEEFPDEDYAGQLILRIGKEDASIDFVILADEDWYRKMFVAFLAALKLQESMDKIKDFKGEKRE
jgi:hypothetical protein